MYCMRVIKDTIKPSQRFIFTNIIRCSRLSLLNLHVLVQLKKQFG